MASRKSPSKKTPSRSRPASKRTSRSSAKPVGLDLGTSSIVAARENGSGVRSKAELNAFLELPTSRFTEQILDQNQIDFVRDNGHLVVFGNGAFKFANMFNAETRRPMRHGLVNASEPYAQRLLSVIVEKLVGKPKRKGQTLCFSVPGPPQDSPSSLVYHEALMKQMLDSMGFDAQSINEGLAIVFSELQKKNFTGIGISFGGGLTNVCLAYLSVPVFSFAIDKGGDDVDESVGEVTGETATRVKAIKEDGLDLNKKARNKIAGALQIYYADLIESVVDGIDDALSSADRMPKIDKAMPVVLGGGSALPKGFAERFKKALDDKKLPIEIASVRMAKEPLTATARGALLKATYEN